MHVATGQLPQDACRSLVRLSAFYLQPFGPGELANFFFDRAEAKAVMEPERAAAQRLTVVLAKLIGVDNEPFASEHLVKHAQHLEPQEGGFATAILAENIQAGIQLPEQCAAAAVTDRHAVRQDQVTHRAFEWKALPGQQPHDRDTHTLACVRQVDFIGICMLEMQCLAMHRRQRCHRNIDHFPAAFMGKTLDGGQRLLDFLFAAERWPAQAICARNHAAAREHIA